MGLKFKIEKVHQDLGSVEVNYFDSDDESVNITLNIELPIVNGEFPTRDEIVKIISDRAPHEFINRRKMLSATAVDMTNLNDLSITESTPAEIILQVDTTDTTTLPYVRKFLQARDSLLADLSQEEREEYISGYLAMIDEYHASNPKWVKLGMLEKAKCVNFFFPANTDQERQVKISNVNQLLSMLETL